MKIEDVWKHVSNKVANSVNDPYEELVATILPINDDNTFGTPISSADNDWEGNTYAMISGLIAMDNPPMTEHFAYYCPGINRDPEDKDVILGHTLLMAVLNGHEDMSFAIWNIEDNEVTYFTEEETDEVTSAGALVVALASLAMKIEIFTDKLGEMGQVMKEALILAKETHDKVTAAAEKYLKEKE